MKEPIGSEISFSDCPPHHTQDTVFRNTWVSCKYFERSLFHPLATYLGSPSCKSQPRTLFVLLSEPDLLFGKVREVVSYVQKLLFIAVPNIWLTSPLFKALTTLRPSGKVDTV
jgi:hypothetical protein